ncbi:MAG: hypothetical protein AMJ79_02995 [Phycisphaerae bacterium SM23_30]|nr:MAG: hypothetical protein AMJ79_02995 [Phycisphaerae bacterium SM23_30]
MKQGGFISHLRRLKRKKEPRFGVSDSIYYHMTSEYGDVLQNVEFALVSAWRHDPEIDDRLVAAALKAAINGAVPANQIAADLVDSLAGVRQFRGDISDNLWTDGLKVVLNSVHNHSNLRPGNRGYLNFAGSFIV